MAVIDSRKILIVENSSEDREIFRDYLIQEAEFDYVFWEEATGKKGLQWLKNAKPDCILLDYILPDMNGLDFLNELTRTTSLIPPVVMLNDQTSTRVAVQALKTGATDYLIKGELNGETLRGAIRSAIESAELKRQLAEQQRELENMRQEFKTLTENLPDIIARFNRQFQHVFINSAIERATGLAPQNFIGKTNQELGMPEEQCKFWEQKMLQVFETGQEVAFEFSFAGPDQTNYYESRVVPEFGPNGSIEFVLSVTRDITDYKLNEEEHNQLLEREQLSRQQAEHAARKTAQLQAVTAALSQSLTTLEVTNVIVRQGIEALDAFAGSAALLHPSGEYLEVVNSTGYSNELVDLWVTIPIQAPVPLTEAIRTRSLVLVETMDERRSRFPLLPESEDGLPGSLAVIPLEIEGRSLGVIGLSFSTFRQFSEEDRTFMLTLGLLCTQALERARLYEAEQQARKQAQQAQNDLAFLAEAGVTLNANLNDTIIMDSLAQLLIPNFADWGVLSLKEEGRPLYVRGLAHSDPTRTGLLQRLLELYPSPPEVALEVMQTHQPFYASEISDDLLNNSFEDEQQRELVKQLGAGSVIVLPLIVRGQNIGALGLNSATFGFYKEDHLPLLLEIARRVARALDNAWLYRRAQTLAMAQIELNELKDLFMSIASHELRTPLTAAKGYTQVLQRNMLRQNQSRSHENTAEFSRNLNLLNNSLYQLDRLNGLIGTLLDFSRIQNGKLELNYTDRANLTGLVQRVVEHQQQTTNDHVLKIEAGREDVIDSYDEARLEQVLTNLISNAIKYSPGGTTVTIGIQPDTSRKEVIVCVRDEGYGINPDVQARIFERFYRARTEENSRVDGLGLGLYISHEIIVQHGGRMWLESKPGAGSTFYFSLPLL